MHRFFSVQFNYRRDFSQFNSTTEGTAKVLLGRDDT